MFVINHFPHIRVKKTFLQTSKIHCYDEIDLPKRINVKIHYRSGGAPHIALGGTPGEF